MFPPHESLIFSPISAHGLEPLVGHSTPEVPDNEQFHREL
jgi:hypothetical protein